MIIRQATPTDKEQTLKILDAFNDYSNSLNPDWDRQPSSFSREHSGEMFDQLVSSPQARIFIALEAEQVIGIIEVHKVPRLRKASYYGEIDSLFVEEDFRGTTAAKQLMQAVYAWARAEKLDCLRLSSGHGLERAHHFYEKMGFKDIGKSYKSLEFVKDSSK